jgi:hypothetical protein
MYQTLNIHLCTVDNAAATSAVTIQWGVCAWHVHPENDAAIADLLQVSQFTLYGMAKGNKPDFHLAMPPDKVS